MAEEEILQQKSGSLSAADIITKSSTGLKQQKALESGAKEYVMFGKNEEGGHNFHRWVDHIIDTKDEDLSKLFMTG